MTGKILIVEDEPIVALDLQQELENFGCEIVGLAQSADEALMAVEECRPDLALMDIHIVGNMDGIQTARLLRDAYQVPVIFLTAFSDDSTIARAAREMPYGYLTKPFKARELKATIRVALHKARVDAGMRIDHGKITATVNHMPDALLMVSLTGDIQFMNTSAESLTGCSREHATGRPLQEVLHLKDTRNRPLPILTRNMRQVPVEEFGLTLIPAEGTPTLIDLTIAPVAENAGVQWGYVITLRKAEERMRSQAIEEVANDADLFELAPMAMVQLDGTGHIVRVNDALLRESGLAAERLVGRTLAGLSMDPDPRIAGTLVHKLLQGGATVTSPNAPLLT